MVNISKEYAKDFACLNNRIFCILAQPHVSLDEAEKGVVKGLTNIGGKLIKNGAFILALCRYVYNYSTYPSKAKMLGEKYQKGLTSDRAFFDFESKGVFDSFK